MTDLRHAFRQLLQNPGFTAVAVLTLALGIGANTAIFSFVNPILLRPLPFKEPEQLVMVFTSYLQNDSHRNWVAAPALDEWRKQSTVFEGLAARSFGSFVLTGKGQPENISGSLFSANIFRLLGIPPVLGRDFLPEEETHGKDHVVLLSHELWRRRFGGDTGIIGQSITLNDESYSVIGVMPPRTFFPDRRTQLWTPLAFGPEQLRDHGSHNYLVYGRLKPGVSPARANAELEVIARRMAQADERYKGSGAEVYSLPGQGSAPRERPHHDSTGRVVCGATASGCPTLGSFRGRGPLIGGDWTLRRARVQRHATDAGNRHPPCIGRAAQRRALPGPSAGNDPGAGRRCDWFGWSIRIDAGAPDAAV